MFSVLLGAEHKIAKAFLFVCFVYLFAFIRISLLNRWV